MWGYHYAEVIHTTNKLLKDTKGQHMIHIYQKVNIVYLEK